MDELTLLAGRDSDGGGRSLPFRTAFSGAGLLFKEKVRALKLATSP
jgi:hypothetical protein